MLSRCHPDSRAPSGKKRLPSPTRVVPRERRHRNPWKTLSILTHRHRCGREKTKCQKGWCRVDWGRRWLEREYGPSQRVDVFPGSKAVILAQRMSISQVEMTVLIRCDALASGSQAEGQSSL
ncbi:hypothetical protein BKA81DRAFT_368841 [Phyllosticta paracitricarpa]